jgi:hypothetical protein
MQIYNYRPIKIDGMSGVVILDIAAIGFLMDMFEIEQYERKKIFERIEYYHKLINKDKK